MDPPLGKYSARVPAQMGRAVRTQPRTADPGAWCWEHVPPCPHSFACGGRFPPCKGEWRIRVSACHVFAAIPGVGVRPVCLFGQFQRWYRWGSRTSSGGAGWEVTQRRERGERSKGNLWLLPHEWVGMEPWGPHARRSSRLTRWPCTDWGQGPSGRMSLTYFSQLPPGLQWSSVNSLFTAASRLWKWGVGRNRVGGSQSDRVTTWPQINVSLVNKIEHCM